MHTHFSPWSYFLQASFPIQCIFIILCVASISTWVFILNRLLLLKSLNKSYKKFEKEFWSDIKLTELYKTLPDEIPPEHLSAIFYSGFTEFYRLRNNGCQTLKVLLEGVSRAMSIAKAQAEIHLERHLYWLGIIASSTPYLGLIGTLLSIISTLSALGASTSPNGLLLITPGIAEALMISLTGLLTSLPALVFYHIYSHQVDQLLQRYHIFQEEFTALLLRQAYEEQHEKLSTDS